jgi:hypothetical protein
VDLLIATLLSFLSLSRRTILSWFRLLVRPSDQTLRRRIEVLCRSQQTNTMHLARRFRSLPATSRPLRRLLSFRGQRQERAEAAGPSQGSRNRESLQLPAACHSIILKTVLSSQLRPHAWRACQGIAMDHRTKRKTQLTGIDSPLPLPR